MLGTYYKRVLCLLFFIAVIIPVFVRDGRSNLYYIARVAGNDVVTISFYLFIFVVVFLFINFFGRVTRFEFEPPRHLLGSGCSRPIPCAAQDTPLYIKYVLPINFSLDVAHSPYLCRLLSAINIGIRSLYSGFIVRNFFLIYTLRKLLKK